jgi:iron complex transport system substrate-binding protein
MRVISLLASGTEIVCALGAEESLVGRSHECDYPQWVSQLPSCTAPAFDVHVSSRQIDAEVNRRIRAKEPLYHIDVPLIARLRPDLLITQAHCEVCAVTPGDVERAGCAIPVKQSLALSAGSVEGIYAGIMEIAQALGRPDRGAQLVQEMRDDFESLKALTCRKSPPTVVVLEWTDPIFAMGNWGPELVEAAGGRLLLGHHGQHSRAIPWEQVLDADPDFLIIAPCGFGLDRSLGELPTMRNYPGWNSLRAVRDGKVVFADGNRYFNRSGVTICDTARLIADIIHDIKPHRFDSAWKRAT